MASRDGMNVLREAVILHSATNISSSCKGKRSWWKGNPEAKGFLIQENQKKYAMRFGSSTSDTCVHNLPRAGNAVILRHKTSHQWKTLFIAEIKKKNGSCGDLSCLTVSFSNGQECVEWEKELRRRLQVYSFPIEIEAKQLIRKGPATIHVTGDYVCITTNGIDSSFKVLYIKKNIRNSVNCSSVGACQTLDIHCCDGHTETIDFRSKHFSKIKTTIDFFKCKATMKKREKENCDKKEDCSSNTFEDHLKNVHAKPLDVSVQSTNLRYTNGGPFGKKASKDDESVLENQVNSAPCMYSYNSLDSAKEFVNIDALKREIKSEDLYIRSKDLISLSRSANGNFFASEEKEDPAPETFSGLQIHSPCVPKTESFEEQDIFMGLNGGPKLLWFGNASSPIDSNVRTVHSKDLHSDISDFVPKGASLVQQQSSREHGGSQQHNNATDFAHCPSPVFLEDSYPSLENLPKDNNPQTVSPLLLPPVSYTIPQRTPVCITSKDKCLNNLDSVGESHKSSNDTLGYSQCSDKTSLLNVSESQPIQESADDIQEDSFKMMEYNQPKKSPKLRQSVEEWIPKNLHQVASHQNLDDTSGCQEAPIIPMKRSVSLQPQNHIYENVAKMKVVKDRQDIPPARESVATMVSVFASEMDFRGGWTIGVMMLKRDENCTFELLKSLESEYDRHQITPPRSFDIMSDTRICISECSQGFSVIGQRSHCLKYEDIKQLGPSKWIVTEFQFLHDDENTSVFKCDIGVEPELLGQEFQESHFTSQNISIVKIISKSELNPCGRDSPTPPRSRLPLRTLSRQALCRDLDLPSCLGNNWKDLAGRIGLDIREIDTIENKRPDSCSEEVLRILECRYPENCSIDFLEKTFQQMKRLDLLEHLQ